MIYKTQHRKLKVEQHVPQLKTNNDLQNKTQKTKDWATRTPVKTNNDLQNTTHKTKDWATRTPVKNKQWSTKHKHYTEN